MSKDLVNVLYVEDDESDIDFAHSAFKDIGAKNLKLDVIVDGETAINFLNTPGTKAKPLPDMILLDLNLPKVHGKEILKMIKESPVLRRIPVVVLSTSSYQKDVNESYHLGAAGFFTKPTDYDEYKNTFQSIYDYWLRRAALPSLEEVGTGK